MIVIVWHVLSADGATYDELGADYFETAHRHRGPQTQPRATARSPRPPRHPSARRVITNVVHSARAGSAPPKYAVHALHGTAEFRLSYAVAASSAIPLIMNPQLMTTQPQGFLPDEAIHPSPEEGLLDFALSLTWGARALRNLERIDAIKAVRNQFTQVVVDGGVWANYPGLCFTDTSLRHYHRAPDIDDYPVVGFVLDGSIGFRLDVPAARRRGTGLRAFTCLCRLESRTSDRHFLVFSPSS